MKKRRKSCAFNPRYESPSQGVLAGFETPFERELDPENRWIVLAHLISWDELAGIYRKQVGIPKTGREGLNPRIIIGSLIIKYLCHLDDRETVDRISENVYMQYFLGYSGFVNEKPFDASLFVEIRKRLGIEVINAMNEKIISLKTQMNAGKDRQASHKEDVASDKEEDSTPQQPNVGNRGRLLMDATACPQDIAYPTDLDLLSQGREVTEQLIDILYNPGIHSQKPRTYRKVAGKGYLQTAQKKNKSKKVIRRAVGAQLGYLGRNIRSIHKLLDSYDKIPLKYKYLRCFWIVQTLYDQQLQMFGNRTHTIEDRIVSIHQAHVRPIVRGKSRAKVEFGAKIHVSVIDGISFLDELSWDAFNEGSQMESYLEKYRKRFGFYPREVLADQIYCTRANRRMLQEKGIVLKAKPLGRPSAVTIHVSPGERNPIEGKFGQAKTGYGLNRIKARLKDTGELWIAGIILALNLVKPAGAALPCLIQKWVVSFSARIVELFHAGIAYRFYPLTELRTKITCSTEG
ncbi:MAG: IS5 family transposase [Tannerella sp.]|nr:IS5 family transposase [Tannerella sp.]